MLNLDIGSGNNVKEGFEGVDVIAYPNVKHLLDVTKDWKWKDDTVDEISCTGFLEHLSFEEAAKLMQNFYKSMKKGGRVEVEVPDIEWCCDFFVKNPGSRYRYLYNDDRAIVFLFGMQNNSFEFHKFGYTQECLELFIKSVGFKRVVVKKQFSHGQQMLLAEGWKL